MLIFTYSQRIERVSISTKVHRVDAMKNGGDGPDIADVAAMPNVRSMSGSHRPISYGHPFKAWVGYQVGSHSIDWFQA